MWAEEYIHFKDFAVFESSDIAGKICFVPGTEKKYDLQPLRLKEKIMKDLAFYLGGR